MKILQGCLFIFLGSLSTFILSILQKISANYTANVVFAVISGLFTVGYIVGMISVRISSR
jgi:hypothetical protein